MGGGCHLGIRGVAKGARVLTWRICAPTCLGSTGYIGKNELRHEERAETRMMIRGRIMKERKGGKGLG